MKNCVLGIFFSNKPLTKICRHCRLIVTFGFILFGFSDAVSPVFSVSNKLLVIAIVFLYI